MTSESTADWVPSACTLPTADRPLRVAEFETLFRAHLREIERVDPTRLRLTLSGTEDVAARVADLARRETECCSFFRFDLVPAADGLAVDVHVPAAHVDVLDGLAAAARASR